MGVGKYTYGDGVPKKGVCPGAVPVMRCDCDISPYRFPEGNTNVTRTPV